MQWLGKGYLLQKGQVEYLVIARYVRPGRAFVVFGVYAVEIHIKRARAVFEAQCFKRNGNFGHPYAIQYTGFTSPFVIPRQAVVLASFATIGNEAFAQYAKWVDAEKKGIGFILIGIDNYRNTIVGATPVVPAQGGGYVLAGPVVVAFKEKIQVFIVIGRIHLGLADGSGSVGREVLIKNCSLPVPVARPDHQPHRQFLPADRL